MRAGYIYLLMASFGTLSLLLAFGLLAGADGNYAFDAMRAAHPTAALAALVLVLAIVGAGSKAGVVPLHVWLPLAHPAAPSHVSALMSGVMTKVAVYGFIRIVFDLLGPPDWWWSMVVLGVGGITAVMGVLYALMQHDLKRLLAYHTVENIGIIFIGLGLALAFKAANMPLAAALALTAALFHVFNHSVFKSLLFFGAGAVLNCNRRARHGASRRADPPHAADRFRLPGRLRRDFGAAAAQRLRLGVADLPGDSAQPATAAMGPEIHGAGGRRAAGAVGGACRRLLRQGVRRHLSRPARTPAAAQAQETDRNSLAAMYFLAALCLVAGILPGFFIDALNPVTSSLIGVGMPQQAGVEWLSIVPIAESRSSYNGLWCSSSSRCPARSPPSPSTGWRPTDCAALRPGIAAIRTRARRRNTPRRASPSRSAASSARPCSARARSSRCRRRVRWRRRGSRRPCTT